MVGSTPVPAEKQVSIIRIVNAVKQWNVEAVKCEGPEIMSYRLEHKYSKASLSLKGPKNVNRAVWDVLLNVRQ